MSLNDDSMVMPVSPIYNNGGGNGFSGDWGSWIILFLLFGMFNNGWNNGGANGMNAGLPWMMSQNTDNLIASGFANQGVNSALNGIQNAITSGFGDVQNSLCGGFAGVNASVNGAQNALAQQLYTNQIADLERSFAEQTATTQGMNAIAMNQQNCCCENRANIADLKYTVATENCADRTAAYQNTRDIIDSQTRGTQAILDKLCQLELDGVKAQVDAKNDRINELQTQLNMANLAASQTAQNAFISQGFANEVDQLYNRLNNCPVPTTPVYGRTPIFTCNQQANSCGCGM